MPKYVLSSILALAGCAGAPASPEAIADGEQRLLQPFLRDSEVVCNELLVEASANFFGHVTRPAQEPTRREAGDGYIDAIWTNPSGLLASALRFQIGEPAELGPAGSVLGPRTRFLVLNQVRLRMFEGRHAMTLNAYARGANVEIHEASLAKPRVVGEFAVVDGTSSTR